MNKKYHLFLIIALVLLSIPSATARPNYFNKMEQKYPQIKGTKLDTCGMCHISREGGGERNSYGKVYESKNRNFSAIENFDSDKDGFSNIEEINALTFPGNASDYPKSTETPVKTNTPSSPGFDFILGILGLLTVISLLKKL